MLKLDKGKGWNYFSSSWLTDLTDISEYKKKPERHISLVDTQKRFWYFSIPFVATVRVLTHWCGGVFVMQIPSDSDVDLSPDWSFFWFPYPSDPESLPVCHTITSPDQSRLWQPHTAEPVWRRGAAGPPPAGGAHSKHMHVTVEGRCSPGLAGGCHGNAHVHPSLLWKRQKWQGTPLT